MEDHPRFIIGHHDPKRSIPVTLETVQDAHAANYDMVTSPITTPHFHSQVLTLLSTSLSHGSTNSEEDITKTKNASPVIIPPLTPADTPLTPDESISQVIGVTSSWIDLGSPDPIIADISRQVLKLELAYAAFCGLTYAVIPGPRLRGQGASDSGTVQYARAIMDALSQGPYMQLYIWLPMIDHSDDQVDSMGDLASFARPQFLDYDEYQTKRLDLFGTWEAWDMIRSICKYPSRLCVALSIPKSLPPAPLQLRWYSEPVRILTLDRRAFTKNNKGYPVLSRSHQAFILKLSRLRTTPWFLLCDVGSIPNTTNGFAINSSSSTTTNAFPTLSEAVQGQYLEASTPHLSYMRNLQTKQPAQTAFDRFGAGYQDYLQAPLQPLTVNLESITYEVFEKDPIKYEWYERAIARALHDWIEQGKPTSNPDGRVVVAVVGAGRGPLVTRALKASEDVDVEIDMWALEKNPNAFVLLQRHNETTWANRVNLVKSDMRSWCGPVRSTNATGRVYNTEEDEASGEESNASILTPSTPTPYKIDILISELLGSFGDNELSPECLDGVHHLLNPVHGISIPASYTAHLTPIAAPKLHADILHGMSASHPNAAETPYVVMLNAVDYLSTTIIAHADDDGHGSGQNQNALSPSPQAQSPIPSSKTTPAPYSKAHTRRSPPQSPPISTPPAPTPASSHPIVGTTWSFQHPNPSIPAVPSPNSINNTTTISEPLSNAHNARSSTLVFPIPHRGTCHGLAGYFEAVLYKGVELSTNPNTMDTKSEGMISWFPIYFPLKDPLSLPDDSELVVTMWRKTDDRKVWYEWIVDAYMCLPAPLPLALPSQSETVIAQSPPHPHTAVAATTSASPSTSLAGKGKGHAPSAPMAVTGPGAGSRRGRRFRIGSSGLHSSQKEACLM